MGDILTTANITNAFVNTLIVIMIIPVFGTIFNLIKQGALKILSSVTSAKTANIIVNRLTFIGVVHHELSHALLAFLTGAKIESINLFKPDKNTGTLGNVRYIPRGNKILQSVQLTFSSVAPTPCGVLSSILIVYLVIPKCVAVWQFIIVYYTLVSIILHMDLSKQDIKVALKGAPILMLLTYIILLITRANLIELLKGIIKS